MDQDARRIDAIMRVSAKMITPVRDHAFPACGGEAFGDDQAGEARADDQEIGGGVSFQ
jgi:hypothetical protein